ncbi:hypothetical protein L3X38_003278 [Prunus dulcis]|uniref:Rit1 N-terminal domain-containing protein n=1 Tax=Prunus dulcis TaxID=3755 RepID=A0AAD5F1L8_PRUDU|nr:hypothetical protein L3X38_003278 [Prunus dulcis]
MEDDDTKQLSIYRAARTIKRRENTLYNALKSIYDDSIFVGEILQDRKEGSLLDATRRGKRFPDSMSKTIPIWTYVLNQFISNHLNKMRQPALFNDGVN